MLVVFDPGMVSDHGGSRLALALYRFSCLLAIFQCHSQSPVLQLQLIVPLSRRVNGGEGIHGCGLSLKQVFG